MTVDVFGIGNALVDIQVQVPDAILTQIGFPKGIMTLVEEHDQIRVLASLKDLSVHRCAGGSAANTIMGLVDLGGKGAYAGKVGQDDLGNFWLKDMREQGVRIEVPQCLGQTGACAIMITEDAQRTMLTHLGVSSTLGAQDIIESEVKQAKFLYVEGYLYTGDSTMAAAQKGIYLAKKNGVRVAFTVSDPFLVNMHRQMFWQMIEQDVDLLFCNLEEARSLTGLSDPLDCAQQIHQRTKADLAMTLGAEGSLLVHSGTVTPVEGVPTDAIDTTGAGDMYAAGLLYGLTNGLTWRQAGHLASHASSRIVSQLGARLERKFTPEEVRELVYSVR